MIQGVKISTPLRGSRLLLVVLSLIAPQVVMDCVSVVLEKLQRRFRLRWECLSPVFGKENCLVFVLSRLGEDQLEPTDMFSVCQLKEKEVPYHLEVEIFLKIPSLDVRM